MDIVIIDILNKLLPKMSTLLFVLCFVVDIYSTSRYIHMAFLSIISRVDLLALKQSNDNSANVSEIALGLGY